MGRDFVRWYRDRASGREPKLRNMLRELVAIRRDGAKKK